MRQECLRSNGSTIDAFILRLSLEPTGYRYPTGTGKAIGHQYSIFAYYVLKLVALSLPR
jgi:hypothetical protein